MPNSTCCLSKMIRCLLCWLILSPSYASADLALNNGTTTTLDSVTDSENISLGAGIEIINTDGTSDVLTGTISGSGELVESGGGTLTLTGSNTYSGGTLVEGGSTLSVGASANLGNASGGLTLDNGTLLTTSGITTSENISLGTSGSDIINTDRVSDTLTGTISGSGELLIFY